MRDTDFLKIYLDVRVAKSTNSFTGSLLNINRALHTNDIAMTWSLFPCTLRKFIAQRRELEREFLRSPFLRASRLVAFRNHKT